MSRSSVFACILLLTGAALFGAACTQDFDKFEGAGGAGSELSERDAAADGQGASDASDGDACAASSACVATQSTCRSDCER
ncbi:MAG: hypothetical protein K0S65_2787, partial [Labilithrix sp.]|nr:hypothetical protein [Labilithrix sp.]